MIAQRRRAAARRRATLSPRFARLVRESWWLLVVAAFVYLALILATYTQQRSRLVVLRHRRADRATAAASSARGSPICCSTCSACRRGGGSSAASCSSSRAIAASCDPEHRARSSACARRRSASRWCCWRARRSKRCASGSCRATLPLAPGGAFGDVDRQRRSRAALGFNGATLLLLALFAVGLSLFFGVSWLRVMERIGAGVEALVARLRRAARGSAWTGASARSATAEREQVVEHCARRTAEREPVVVVPPARAVPKSERVVKEKQRPLFTDMPDSPLPPLSLLEDAPPSHGDGQRRDARVHVAPDRAQARRLRRRA